MKARRSMKTAAKVSKKAGAKTAAARKRLSEASRRLLEVDLDELDAILTRNFGPPPSTATAARIEDSEEDSEEEVKGMVRDTLEAAMRAQDTADRVEKRLIQIAVALQSILPAMNGSLRFIEEKVKTIEVAGRCRACTGTGTTTAFGSSLKCTACGGSGRQ